MQRTVVIHTQQLVTFLLVVMLLLVAASVAGYFSGSLTVRPQAAATHVPETKPSGPPSGEATNAEPLKGSDYWRTRLKQDGMDFSRTTPIR